MPQETRLDWDFLGTVAERWGIEWARTLRDAIADGELIDMGRVELFARCPNHHGKNIANHPCEICGHPQAPIHCCVPVVQRWDAEPPNKRAQLTFEGKTQLRMEV